MTGDCGDRSADGYRAFEKIAAVSSGQVYRFNKQNVNDMVEYLEEAIRAHKVSQIHESYSMIHTV